MRPPGILFIAMYAMCYCKETLSNIHIWMFMYTSFFTSHIYAFYNASQHPSRNLLITKIHLSLGMVQLTPYLVWTKGAKSYLLWNYAYFRQIDWCIRKCHRLWRTIPCECDALHIMLDAHILHFPLIWVFSLSKYRSKKKRVKTQCLYTQSTSVCSTYFAFCCLYK